MWAFGVGGYVSTERKKVIEWGLTHLKISIIIFRLEDSICKVSSALTPSLPLVLLANKNFDSDMQHAEELRSRVYFLGMKARGGKFRGMRGAMYAAANELVGYRLREADQEDPIRYGDPQKGEDPNDIYMNIYFMENIHRHEFINRVHRTHKIPDLIARDHNPVIEAPVMHSYMAADSQLLPILESDFEAFTPPGSIDYDQALQNLSTFRSSSAAPSASAAPSPSAACAATSAPSKRKSRSSSSCAPSIPGRSSPRLSGGIHAGSTPARRTLKWQSFERHIPGTQMCSCHLLPRTMTGVTFERNPSNFVGGYGSFHDGLDGNNSDPSGIPRFVLEFLGAEETYEEADDGLRQKVHVRIRFRDVQTAQIWVPIWKLSFKEECVFQDDGTIESFMHVREAFEFQANMEMKQAITLKNWRQNGYCV